MKPGQHEDLKVFGLGLGKTGTRSLADAMKVLGYTVKHAPRDLSQVHDNDFTNDLFIATRYRFLDYVYPNAKFLCTYRDLKPWLASASRFDKKRGLGGLRRMETRFDALGAVCFNEEKFIEAHEKYYREVREYFAGRDDFLEINVCMGDGYDKICPFLGKPIPNKPFPHSNQQVAGDDRTKQ